MHIHKQPHLDKTNGVLYHVTLQLQKRPIKKELQVAVTEIHEGTQPREKTLECTVSQRHISFLPLQSFHDPSIVSVLRVDSVPNR